MSASANDGLGDEARVPRDGWRAKVRANPALHQVYRVGVFIAGLVFIALGIALMALPGPLTIPPVLVGLWIWSTEFRFAQRLFDSFKVKARDAWTHAKAHPVSSSLVTVGGLVLAAVAIWAVSRYELVEKAKQTIL